MKKTILVVVLVCSRSLVYGQVAAPTPTASSATTPAAAADVEALRQQVTALTEMVKTLQQQVKDQQAAIEKVNPATPQLPQSEESSPPESASGQASPAASPPQLFPTTDDAVVASGSTAAPLPPNANATATAFPTTDASVTASGGSSLTQPITIAGGGGGNKNYMNISFDGMFALAASSARDLHHLEVGDHDPQQRGFNARNAEIALDGAVDPYFEGFANIVLKLDNNNETEIELEEAFMQTTNLPFGLQLKRRTVLRCFWPSQSDASAYLGVRGYAACERSLARK